MIRGKAAHVLDRLDPRNGRLAIASTFFTNSILMYSCEPDDLQRLLCPGIDVDVIGGRGHLAVAFVDQRDFRPRGFPRWAGRDFFMVEYLAFVTYESSDGRQMRGLYLLQSDTPSTLACIGSRVFSHYRFRKIDLTINETDTTRRFTSTKARIDVAISLDTDTDTDTDTDGSEEPWADYGQLSKPRSFNFQHLKRSNATLVIRGVLKGWTPRPATVLTSDIAAVEELGINFDGPPKAIEVDNVEYLWRNSRIDT